MKAMRRILFRGKNLFGKWIEGDLLQYLVYGKMHIVRNSWGAGGQEVDPETVGQYTGLTDMNGNKIFEGDLCLCDRNISKHIDKKVFEIKFDPEAGFFGESNTSNIYPSDFYMCEIVGNVFDTPEFLEVGEMP